MKFKLTLPTYKVKDIVIAVRYFLPLAVAVTGVCSFSFFAVEQSLRLSANDPQIQISEDLAVRFNAGEDPKATISSQVTDISQSLATFVIVYDKNEQVLVSSAILDSQTPQLPNGVLEYAKNHGGHRLLWQPKPGVRMASVIVSYDAGFVLIGRSLKEVEARKLLLLKEMAIIWAFIMFATFTATILFIPKPLKK